MDLVVAELVKLALRVARTMLQNEVAKGTIYPREKGIAPVKQTPVQHFWHVC